MHESISSLVADNVRAEVARANMTQAQLATLLELSQQAVSAKLSGKTRFTVDEIVLIAQSLGVEPSTMLPQSSRRAS